MQYVQIDIITSKLPHQNKKDFTSEFPNHLSQAQAERQYYLDCSKTSDLSPGTPPQYAHYIFDFAEQLHLPHSHQVGPLYFKVGRFSCLEFAVIPTRFK